MGRCGLLVTWYTITMSKIYSKTCKQCGKDFVANAHNALFCSGKCRGKALYQRDPRRFKRWRDANKEREQKRAREYHKMKMLDPQYVARKRRNSKEFKLKNPINGPMNHDKANFDGNKLPTMERDLFTCQLCGFVGYGYVDRRLAVHHIDGDRKHNSLDNLITLCDSCHKFLTGYQSYKRFLNRITNKKLVLELAEKLQ